MDGTFGNGTYIVYFRTTTTTSVDIGFIVKGSIQISQGGGIWIVSVTFGPGVGAGTSTIDTVTEGGTIIGSGSGEVKK